MKRTRLLILVGPRPYRPARGDKLPLAKSLGDGGEAGVVGDLSSFMLRLGVGYQICWKGKGRRYLASGSHVFFMVFYFDLETPLRNLRRVGIPILEDLD